MISSDVDSVDLFCRSNQHSLQQVNADDSLGQQVEQLSCQLVVLVHGLGAPKFAMRVLKWELDKAWRPSCTTLHHS